MPRLLREPWWFLRPRTTPRRARSVLQRRVGGVAIAEERLREVSQDGGRSVRRATRQEPVAHCVLTHNRPDLPAFPIAAVALGLLVQQAPVCLVDADDRLLQHVTVQPLVQGLEEFGQRRYLVPQRSPSFNSEVELTVSAPCSPAFQRRSEMTRERRRPTRLPLRPSQR